MKKSIQLSSKWESANNTILRFPLTILFILAAVITNTLAILTSNNEPYINITLTLGIGALIYAVFQLLYERFCNKHIYRYLFITTTLLLSFLYYLYINNTRWVTETLIRTLVIFFILIVSFLWVPSVKSQISFNQSFMVVFKTFFMTVFLNGVLFIGILLVFAAIDNLLFNINEKVYLHCANIIFVLIAPVHFLIYIPVYPGLVNQSRIKQPGKEDTAKERGSFYEVNNESINKVTIPGKILETLISYILIPITAIFTFILLIYIITNITGNFWTDNLLEPMLVAYSIIVIIVYLLASTIENAWTRSFRRVFPKVLVLVVLFQTISSTIRISKYGITYGKYYAILFGIFAIIAGIVFCIKPKEKNGLIAPFLIILSLISIMPGVGAFTISRINQTNRLQTALERNNMLDEERIRPSGKISDEEKQIIISSITYLNRMDYTKNISWLSEYRETQNFEMVFGFPMYSDTEDLGRYINIHREQNNPIPLEGYDFMITLDIYSDYTDESVVDYTMADKSYTLRIITEQEKEQNIVLESEQTVYGSFTVSDIFKRFIDDESTTFRLKTTEEVTFISDTDKASIKVIVNNLSYNSDNIAENYNAQVYVLIKIK